MRGRLPFYEFFAGGGMARLGLGTAWECTFANEWCPKKAASYRANFGGAPELAVRDVASLTARDLPGSAALVWASFPCQDLSLAGPGGGLNGSRSGTFKPFWRLMLDLIGEGRAPTVIALENVTGALTSHGGRDFGFIVESLAAAGYRTGAMVMDAARFVPQSRPRLFIVGVRSKGVASLPRPRQPWHTRALIDAAEHRRDWAWWDVPEPDGDPGSLARIVEEPPCGVEWHTRAETRHLVGLMAPLHRERVRQAQTSGGVAVGAVYRRTRDGVQRAEVRFDGRAGCLRTPAGGSSRQTLLIVEGRRMRSRLLSPREAARLMGVPEDYRLPERYNDAYHLLGDGVATPVISWLEQHLLRPAAMA